MSELLEFFNAYRAPGQHVASLLLAAAVWRWGGSPERWLMGTFLTTMVLPVYVVRMLLLGPSGGGPSLWVYVVTDIVAAGMFVAIALNANRNYPLLIAGFQIVAVVAHMVKAMVGTVSPLAIAILVIGPSYCQLLLLTGGFVRHAQRQRRFGPYREWRLGSRGAPGWFA